MTKAISGFALTAYQLHERADLRDIHRNEMIAKAKNETMATLHQCKQRILQLQQRDRDAANYRPDSITEQNATTHSFWMQKAKRDFEGRSGDEAVVIAERALKTVPVEAREYYLSEAQKTMNTANAASAHRFGELRNTYMSDGERWSRGLAAAAEHVGFKAGFLDWHIENVMTQAENFRGNDSPNYPGFFDSSILSTWLQSTRAEAATAAENAVASTYKGADPAIVGSE